MSDLIEALVKLQAQLPVVHKAQTANIRSDKGASFSYRYADLTDIADAVYPLMSDCGLAFVAMPKFTDAGRYVLLGRLEHVSGEFREGEYPLPEKADPRTLGSALTYGRRYLLSCLTGVVTDADDDGAAAAAAKPAVTGTARKMRRGAAAGEETAHARQARRLAEAEDVPLPPEPDLTPLSPDPMDVFAPMSDAQMKKLHATFNELGFDRDAGLAFCTSILGREVASTKELSKDDASRVIDKLGSQ